jgi:hypothetical protein
MMIDLDGRVARLDDSASCPDPASAVLSASPTPLPTLVAARRDGHQGRPGPPGRPRRPGPGGRHRHGPPDPPHPHRLQAGPPAYTADPGGARPEVRREYRLEPTADGGCRLDFHLEFDVPKRADPLVKTQLSHQVERFFDELGAIVAVRPAGTPGTLPRPCMPRRWVSGCARGICPGRHRTSTTFGTSSRAVSSGEGR